MPLAFLSLAFASSALVAAPSGSVLAPGMYQDRAGAHVYVGVENELPGPVSNDYYDPANQHVGDASLLHGLRLERPIIEDRRVVRTAQGPLGVSLFRVDARARAVIILIHGNDPETRQMGFLIPYFVLNGINVVCYDQRGTGQSIGNWQQNGPVQRAHDVEALYDAYATNPYVNARQIGLWGFSNGGWTAPIVALHRPIAFMLLKSAPAASVEQNSEYYLLQHMRRRHHTTREIDAAIDTWHTMIGALGGSTPWAVAEQAYARAEKAPWFKDSMLPPHLSFPLPSQVADGYRRAVLYDPTATLAQVRTPTLALFGALDRNVDVAHDSATMRDAFTRAGMSDFSMHIYPDAGHTLRVSGSGFNDDPAQPERLTAAYPGVMLQWLRDRKFIEGSRQRQPFATLPLGP